MMVQPIICTHYSEFYDTQTGLLPVELSGELKNTLLLARNRNLIKKYYGSIDRETRNIARRGTRLNAEQT